MTNPPLIYIAGPYSADSSAMVAHNVRRAAQWAGVVVGQGYGVMCPHTHTHGVARESGLDPFDHDLWMRQSLLTLDRCDGILMLPRWRDSSGARREREYARDADGISVFYVERGGLPPVADFQKPELKPGDGEGYSPTYDEKPLTEGYQPREDTGRVVPPEPPDNGDSA